MNRTEMRTVILPTEDGRLRIPAELGRFEVPVRHDEPDGPRRSLAYARLPARTPRPGSPIVLLVGGPGASGIESLGWDEPGRPAYWDELRVLGDVIALDQRGTGWSWPVPEAIEPWAMPLDHPLEVDEYHELADRQCRAMRRYWAERDDLGAYTVIEAADDVAALAAALEIDHIRVVGASYGSHLGLAVLRRHPLLIERAMLSQVEGPDHTYKLPSRVHRALEGLAARAAEQPELEGGHPDLLGELDDLLAGLSARPIAVPRERETIVVGAYDLQRAIAGTLGDQAAMATLPARLRSLAAGDARWLGDEAFGRRRGWPSSAMSWSTDAASGASPGRRLTIEEERPMFPLGDVIDHPFPSIETAWGATDIGAAFRGPVVSDVPIQFLSGALDGRTPAANVEDIRPGIPNAGHVVVDGIAHDEGLASADVRRHIVSFLAGAEPSDARYAIPFGFRPR